MREPSGKSYSNLVPKIVRASVNIPSAPNVLPPLMCVSQQRPDFCLSPLLFVPLSARTRSCQQPGELCEEVTE